VAVVVDAAVVAVVEAAGAIKTRGCGRA